jgi:hydrogenase expression/formation protein HypD
MLEKRIKELYERNPRSRLVVEKIKAIAKTLKHRGMDSIKIMNFCGTHEWTITHYGLRSLMPENVELIAGPGCPVCITPGHYVDLLIDLSMNGYTILSYGDSYKLPGTRLVGVRSLFDARIHGGDTRVVYSFLDAIKIARENPNRKHVFFAVGFETTMPTTAIPLYEGLVPENLYILSAYRYTPPIMKYLLDEKPEAVIHGVIAPGHVSAVIGSNAWLFLPIKYRIPTVVSGFEPLDVLLSIYYILRMIRDNEPQLINEYTRVVKPEGNMYARKAMSKVYEVRDAYWRGIGIVPKSGGYHRREYLRHDIYHHLGLEDKPVNDILPGCRCPEVVLGLAKPTDCPLFMKRCTPNNPYGPCMVSSEGTCRIWAENLPLAINIDI